MPHHSGCGPHQLSKLMPASWQMMAYPPRTWQRSLSCSLGSRVTHISNTQCLGEQRGQWGLSEVERKRQGHLTLQNRTWKPQQKDIRLCVGGGGWGGLGGSRGVGSEGIQATEREVSQTTQIRDGQKDPEKGNSQCPGPLTHSWKGSGATVW